MRPLAILIAGQPIPDALAARGSFGRMIRGAVAEAWQGSWCELDARAELPDCERFSGLIISGSAANVPTREPWIVATERYLARAVASGMPIFGICFGHQLLGQGLGGLVSRNPRGLEVGTVSLERLADDPLFADSQPSLLVNMTHVDSIVTLPPGARVLARTAQDEHAFVYFGQRTWGVQFHPEMDAEIVKFYLAARQRGPETDARQRGPETDARQRGPETARDTPDSRALLQRFVTSVVAA